jgi:hypothetical protein
MVKRFHVQLSSDDRQHLEQMISRGKTSARVITRARILLDANRGPEKQEWSDTKIAETVEVSRPTVEQLGKRAVTEGVEAALHDRLRWEN